MKNLKSQFKIKNYLLIFTLILTPFLFFNTVNAAYVDITANCSNLICDFTADVIGLDSNLSAQTYLWNFDDDYYT